jgi:hypothetical protein
MGRYEIGEFAVNVRTKAARIVHHLRQDLKRLRDKAFGGS